MISSCARRRWRAASRRSANAAGRPFLRIGGGGRVTDPPARGGGDGARLLRVASLSLGSDIFMTVKTSHSSVVVPLDRCEVACVDPERVAAVSQRLPDERARSTTRGDVPRARRARVALVDRRPVERVSCACARLPGRGHGPFPDSLLAQPPVAALGAAGALPKAGAQRLLRAGRCPHPAPVRCRPSTPPTRGGRPWLSRHAARPLGAGADHHRPNAPPPRPGRTRASSATRAALAPGAGTPGTSPSSRSPSPPVIAAGSIALDRLRRRQPDRGARRRRRGVAVHRQRGSAPRAADRRAQQAISVSFALARRLRHRSRRCARSPPATTPTPAGSASAWPPSPPSPCRSSRGRSGGSVTRSAPVRPSAEAKQTSLCAYLSVALLVGLGAERGVRPVVGRPNGSRCSIIAAIADPRGRPELARGEAGMRGRLLLNELAVSARSCKT